MDKINYIICFFFGNRRSKIANNNLRNNIFYYLDKHIEYLNNNSTINLTSIGINDESIRDKVENYIKNKNINFKYELFFRKNKGFSYGLYNDVIKKNINKFDYYFMIEDDYVPKNKNFINIFKSYMNDKTSFVVQSYSEHFGKIHPSNSIGLVRNKECFAVLENKNNIFCVPDKDLSYNEAWEVQKNYHNYFIESGYEITDITDRYKVVSHNSGDDSFYYYGNLDSDVVIDFIN